MLLRRSRLTPVVLWGAMRLIAPISPRSSGRVAAWLWSVPWQRIRTTTRVAPASTTGDWHTETLDVQLASTGGIGPTRRRVVIRRAGDGPVVLLVHGWADDWTGLSVVARVLMRHGFAVATADLPSHGATRGMRTDGLQFADTITQLAAHVAAEHVVAHSMGGLGTLIALRDGLEVRSVGLFAPVASIETAFDGFRAIAPMSRSTASQLRQLISNRYGADIWSRLAFDVQPPQRTIPAIVFHDHDDERVSLATSRRLTDGWQSATLVESNGLGHRRLVQDEQTAERLAAFLRDT